MEQKHYAKMIRQLVSAGISRTKIAKECGIDPTTVQKVLDGITVTDRIQKLICKGYDTIVANFISLP